MVSIYEIEVKHSIDAGHRVLNHLNADGSPGKCSRIHGHTYAFTITLAGHVLNETGFVVDFGRVKRLLDQWDHRLLLSEDDPFGVASPMYSDDPGSPAQWVDDLDSGVVRLGFNPTAENMADYICFQILEEFSEVQTVMVEVSETPKTVARTVRRRVLTPTGVVNV